MSAWRRKALEAFPSLRRDLQRPGYSIYHLFFDLLPMARESTRDNDVETLRRVFGFAQWCMRSKSKELWNPAGVAFYEHLFDEEEQTWAAIIPWLPPDVTRDVWSLWERRLAPQKLGKLEKMIKRRQEVRYRELESYVDLLRSEEQHRGD